MTDQLRHSFTALGTVVTIHVVGHGANDERDVRKDAVARAAGWFEEVERRCSRFDPDSELSRLVGQVNEPVKVSPLLFEAVRFAVAIARGSDGAFDPTVGARLESLGFDRHHATGDRVQTAAVTGTVSDVELDEIAKTITLHRPVLLDLGGVAKGLAIDLACQELAPLGNFVVDAGGDGFFGGFNAEGRAWSVGIRHPRQSGAIVETLFVSNHSVCTSGDYERVSASNPDVHHLIDPRGDGVASACASVTVVAPTAISADGLATAAFVLGPEQGIVFLEEQGAEGLIFTPAMERFQTRGLSRILARSA